MPTFLPSTTGIIVSRPLLMAFARDPLPVVLSVVKSDPKEQCFDRLDGTDQAPD